MTRRLLWFACVIAGTWVGGAVAEGMDGETVYSRYCAACHDVGTATAPLTSDTDFWASRLEEVGSTSALTNTVLEGKGAMPPKGGCSPCTEDELRLAVETMLPGSPAGPAHNRDAVQTALAAIALPPGFHIALYARDLPGARQMALAPDGTLYVGTRGQGKVYALEPNQEKDAARAVHTLLADLNEPNGVAYHGDRLYVGEIHRIQRYEQPGIKLAADYRPVTVYEGFPNRRWHGYKVLKMSPEGWLYTAVGMPCNTCDYRKSQPVFGTLQRLQPDGGKPETFALGIRNSVGFDWHPATGVLWFSDNGQDMMGDDAPPDEINRAPRAGLDFGFPYAYGNNQPSPGYSAGDLPPGLVPAAHGLQAHVAPLGIAFYTGKQFPKAYHQQLFIAEHGSWNRSSKVGYQLSVAEISAGKVNSVKPFATGWLQGEETLGRPVDVVNLPDGSLLVSDDMLGVIYRISYAVVD